MALKIPTPYATLLFMVGIHFGLHGGQEHRNLRRYPKCQIEREYKDKKDYMMYHEEHLKNNQGEIQSKFYQKPEVVYSFCSGNEPRCFVHILDRYLDLCPPPPFCLGFYLRSKPNWSKEENFNDSYWYTKFPVGKNMLSQTISTMMEKAGIVGNFSNNSLRATAASRLYANNIDEQLITEQTGHRSNAVCRCKHSNFDQKMQVSHLLHGLPAKRAKIQEIGKDNESEVIEIKEVESVKEKLDTKSSDTGASHKVIQNLNISDIVGSADSKSPLIEFHFHIGNK